MSSLSKRMPLWQLPTYNIPSWLFSLTCLLSGLVASFIWLHWMLWQIALLLLISWTPIFFLLTYTIAKNSRWSSLLFLFLVGQTGHFCEHVAQMIQIHILGWPLALANGIFGALNIEWVHFLWNTWFLAMILLFLLPFHSMRILYLLLGIAIWHEIEHIVIFSTYLHTHHQGSPGLLAHGGLLGGGLPLSRPDLHFFYVSIEQLFLLLLCYQLWKKKQPANSSPEIIDKIKIGSIHVQESH